VQLLVNEQHIQIQNLPSSF